VNSKRARQVISQLITFQQVVIQSGGISPLSDPYRKFITQKKTVLRMFSLPETDENLRILFDFPLSHANDYPFPLWENFCRFKRELIVKWFYYDVQKGKPWAKKAGKLWGMDERAGWVYKNLVTRAIEHLSE
jgi:hypothetical protein